MTTDQLHSGGTVSAAALFIGALHLLLLQLSAELLAPTGLPITSHLRNSTAAARSASFVHMMFYFTKGTEAQCF